MNKLIKELGIALICALIIAILHELGVISFVFNNIWMIAIAAFIAFMLLILMGITRKICKADNKDIKKIRIRFGMFTLILIVVVIGIVMFCHKPQDNKVVVPDLTGMEIVKASYKVYDAGLELNPLRVEKHLVTFQDPQAGSLVTKNSSVKIVIGKPSIDITHPIDNSSVNFSYCYITGKSSGMASNYPNLKIYVLIYDFSTFQVQKPPPPQSNGEWQTKCFLEDLQGEQFLIYAIITTREIKGEELHTFPICVATADPINIKRPE